LQVKGNKGQSEVNELISKLGFLGEHYDIVRMVDPVAKRVHDFKDDAVTISETSCFHFWCKNEVCDNCISMRVFNENEMFVKMEYLGDQIYMITGIPYAIEGRKLVIELLKNVTNSMIYDSRRDKNNHNISIMRMISEMNAMAIKDDLTEIYNRRYLNERLPVDLISSAAANQNLSVILMDIDCFKEINDTYGHLVGDHVLKIIAKTIQGCIKRESDWVARYGGEEFLLSLPGANAQTAGQIAERIRIAVEQEVIVYKKATISVTASFGICSYEQTRCHQSEDIIGFADQMLYEAKRIGRNCIKKMVLLAHFKRF
jgi:diguanylate cyclase (GGDEF)-like protein